MKFLLYNIRYAAGTGKRFHLPFPFSGYFKHTDGHLKSIGEFIKSVNPDIVGLVEVDCGSYRSYQCNQAQFLARELRCTQVSHPKYAASSVVRKLPLVGKQGNAILTRHAIVQRRFHFFRVGVKRLVIELELADFSVFLVHLSLSFRRRQSQLLDLVKILQRATKPIILAGDFNVLRGDGELERFLAASGLRSANRSGRPSHPSRAPRRQLDYIFCGPRVRVTDFHIPAVRLSDHVPLVCDVELAS